jgi:hypothetical protein
MVRVEAYFKMYSTAYENHFPAMCLVNEGHAFMSYSIMAKLHALLTTTSFTLRPPLTYQLGGKVLAGQKNGSHSIFQHWTKNCMNLLANYIIKRVKTALYSWNKNREPIHY